MMDKHGQESSFLTVRKGDIVTCWEDGMQLCGMTSLGLYETPGARDYNHVRLVGRLTHQQMALVIDVHDSGWTQEGLDRFRTLLLVSGNETLGWCRYSAMLKRA